MNFFPLCRSLDAIAVNEEILDESLPQMPIPIVGPHSTKFGAHLSFQPNRILRTPTKNAAEEVRELQRAFRRMQAADKRYRKESELLLLQPEVALQEFNRDNTSTERRLEELDVEEDSEKLAEMRAEISYFQEKRIIEEESVAQLRNAKAGLEVDKMAAKLSGGVYRPIELHQTTQIHIDILEDRIEKI